MEPVNQQTLHDPPEQTGDCFRAAVASLLEWPIDRVPDFRIGMPPYDGSPIPDCYECLGVWNSPGFWWWGMLLLWADVAGFEVGMLDADDRYAFDWSDREMIASGPSPRHPDSTHSVVWTGGRDGEVIWDPHPSRDGLAGDPIDWLYIGTDPPWEER